MTTEKTPTIETSQDGTLVITTYCEGEPQIVHISPELLKDLGTLQTTGLPPVPPSPIAALTKALLEDRGYLLGWHSNLAIAYIDALNTEAVVPADVLEARWEAGQEAARRFVSLLFAGHKQRPLEIANTEVRPGIRSRRPK